MRTPSVRRFVLAVPFAAFALILMPAAVLAEGATVTRLPNASDNCHPDMNPETGETFVTCTTASGETQIVETPSGNTVTSSHTASQFTVTSDRTGLVSTGTQRTHQFALVADDHEVSHSNSQATVVTAATTCRFLTVTQFVDGQPRTFQFKQNCDPNP